MGLVFHFVQLMKLCRSQDDRRFAGVCGGMAKAFGWEPERLRLVWFLATLLTAFAGVILYVALWYLMPEEAPPAPKFETLQPWKKPF